MASGRGNPLAGAVVSKRALSRLFLFWQLATNNWQLFFRQHPRHLIAPPHSRWNRQHEPVFSDRPARRLCREPIRRGHISLANPSSARRYARAVPFCRDPVRNASGTNPIDSQKSIRLDILRTPAAIESAPIRASLELRFQQRRPDESSTFPFRNVDLIDDAHIIAFEILIVSDEVTQSRSQGSGFRRSVKTGCPSSAPPRG